LLNRELSWLDLNKRVLDLAADPDEPLLVRVKFCAIFSSNLDEFFMVRVAGLLDQVIARVNVRSPDGRTPQQALADVRERALELTAAQSRLWRDELVPALADEGIVIGTVEDATAEERRELETAFARQIYPVLTPLAVGPGQPFPYISGLSLSLGVTVRDPDSGEERFARVKVPETLPRFVSIGDRGLLIPLEGVISHYLTWVFPGMDLVERAAFRLTRDGDTEISDDADDLLEAVESELRKRRFGAVVRLEVSSSISRGMVARLSERLAVRPDSVYPVHGLLDLREVMQLHDLDRPDLKYEPWVPQTQRRLAKPKDGDLFAEIAASDIVVQHPYDSFATSVEAFVRAAAKDPAVATLKTTVYRTSHDSALAPALIEAAENGKQSVCIVELKARFDERRNIQWSRSLEQAGVHVVYGFPDMKIHAKTTLVIRRDGDGLQRYVHIGTGNYHATTARLYEDVGLFTADPDIAADIADLFNFVTGFGRPQTFRKILVAPFNLRRELVERIRAVGAAAAAGEHARIRIKVNNLVDPGIVEELYRASQAGAEIDLIVRAICVLRPGVEGLSERIRVRSILGRFLEHSRLYCFEAGDERTYLLGSADLMQRNLDHRIEVIVPAEAPHVRAEIETIFRRLLSDNSQAWLMSPDGSWDRVRPQPGERRRASQLVAMRGRMRARRRAVPGA
jgi:polyphosphate kinase